ncbi:glycosyltransferase family 4 protein [Thalassobacillus devorans]|uniref:glycosyltransferase family 4 protein n=1 Tax=Thalassobacillus devorans TaxID=279813 RepID=UPI00048AC2E8|nr:glycosyltransferase family 4 protein [Thalassobacillus devorans]
MKILMLRPNYFPEVAGGTRLAKDLVDDLIAAGHQVEMITPFPVKVDEKVKREYKAKKNEVAQDGSLAIRRIDVPIEEKSFPRRIVKALFVFLGMYRKGLASKNPDLIMTISMPPFIGPLGSILGKTKKVPVVYWEQDIISKSIKKDSKIGNWLLKTLMKKVIRTLETFTVKTSTHTIAISNKFKNYHLQEDKLNPEKISTIYNWIDTSQVNYVKRENNELFQELGLDKDKFYVTYCGNIGYPHNLETFIEAAKKLESYPDIEFLIFGEGSRKEAIQRHREKLNAQNVKMYPLVPLDKASLAYSIGDISIVIGQAGTSENGFPSKTWSIMSAARPVVSSFDIDSELTNIIRDNEAGIAVPPEDSNALKEAILTIYHDRSLIDQMGRNGLNYVENNISREETTAEIIDLFETLHTQNKEGRK